MRLDAKYIHLHAHAVTIELLLMWLHCRRNEVPEKGDNLLERGSWSKEKKGL